MSDRYRKATPEEVVQAIHDTWSIGQLWNLKQWVDHLKARGLISKKTRALDCSTVIKTIQTMP